MHYVNDVDNDMKKAWLSSTKENWCILGIQPESNALTTSAPVTLPHWVGEILQSAFLSVCLSAPISQKAHVKICHWSWLGLTVMIVQCVKYFRFCG